MTVDSTTEGTSAIDRTRVAELTEREMARLSERTPKSKERYERGLKVMPGGVPSSFQMNEPWPVFLERMKGRAATFSLNDGENKNLDLTLIER